MWIVWDFLKLVAAPGSLSLLALVSAIGLAVVRFLPRWRRWGQGLLIGVYGSYLVLALPWVANAIASRIPSTGATGMPRTPPATLVVFAGDNPQARIRTAGTTYAAWSPRDVYVLGEKHAWLVDGLVGKGIPRSRIENDPDTANTREQIARVERLVARGGHEPIAIVASRLQMPRVIGLAHADGLTIIPVPSPVDHEPPASGVRRYLPSYAALEVSRDAIYEHAALRYYAWRGWIPAIRLSLWSS